MSDCALHLSRPHQRPIKYFMNTAFFEVAWEGYYATIITKLFTRKKQLGFAVYHMLYTQQYIPGYGVSFHLNIRLELKMRTATNANHDIVT